MFEAYAIGITLRLHNLVTPELAALGSAMERMEGIVQSLKASFQGLKLNASAFTGITRGAEASHLALDKASRSAAGLERQLAALRAGSAAIPMAPVISPAPGRAPALLPTPGGGGQGGGGNWHNNRGGFHGGNVHMGPGGVGIGTVGLGAGDAFIPLAITAGALYAGHATYESAKDLNTEQQRFKLFGLGEQLNKEAFDFVAAMRVYGSTQAENMRNFREAQGVFRESGLNDSSALEGAKLAAPMLSKLDFLAQSLDAETQAKLKTANMAMLRYVELSGGLKSAADFNRIADFGFKLNMSSGGTVDWEQLRALKATAGVAGYKLSDDALARLEPVIGELKGGGTGTALATAFGRISGVVRVPNQVAHQLVDFGIWDKDQVEFNSQGGIKRMKGNPLSAASTALFQENPELFYERVIRPIYAKMNLGAEDIARENLALFGRTGGRLFTAIENALPTIHKSVEAMDKMKGIVDSIKDAKQSLSGQEQEFSSAWTDFKTQFGTVMLPFFSGILRGGSSLFRTIGGLIGQDKKDYDDSGFLGKAWNIMTLPARWLERARTVLPIAAAGSSNPSDGKAVESPAVRAAVEPASPRSVVLNQKPSAAAQAIADYARGTASPVGDKSQKTSVESRYVASKAQAAPQAINNKIVMPDGRVLAQVVTEVQTKEAGRALGGATGFDSSQFLAPVGLR